MSVWEASLNAISQTSLDAVVILDPAGHVRCWNRHAETMFGWDEEEAIGRPIADLVVPPELRKRFRARFRLISEGRVTELLERRFERDVFRRDGTAIPVEIRVIRTGPGPGPGPLYVCFVRELTAQKQARALLDAHTRELEKAQEQLRDSEQMYRHVVELSSLLPWTSGPDGNILSVGERWSDWTGAPIRHALGQQWLRFVHPEDVSGTLVDWHRALEKEASFDGEWRIRMADGAYRWCRARAAKWVDPATAAIVWYGTLEDVHEQRIATDAYRRIQADLVHVSRISAMGAMGSAIAHDLNQPLTAVAHYVRGCKKLLDNVEGPAKQAIGAGLDDADKSAVRASDIVRRVRAFVKRGHVECTSEPIAALVEEACKFALIDAPSRGIVWRTEFEARAMVLVDRVQIQQVLVNIIRNAVTALEGQTQRRLVIRTLEGANGFCEVSVCDTGRGLSPEGAERMFDPFYTTRKEGTGIGLSISRMIVEAHGGTIWHEPNQAGATIIKFTVPKAACPMPAKAQAAVG